MGAILQAVTEDGGYNQQLFRHKCQLHSESHHHLARLAPITRLHKAYNCYANKPQHIAQSGSRISTFIHMGFQENSRVQSHPRGPAELSYTGLTVNWFIQVDH